MAIISILIEASRLFNVTKALEAPCSPLYVNGEANGDTRDSI